MIKFETSHGNFTVELFTNEAPLSAENFQKYVDDQYFDGTIFHRIIPNFMIQGGGLTAEFANKETRASIKNEAKNGPQEHARHTVDGANERYQQRDFAVLHQSGR